MTVYDKFTYFPIQHHWSGWPGAYCLHCGRPDPMELALAYNVYDPDTNTWKSEELEQKYHVDSICFATQQIMKACPQCYNVEED